jgi:NADPH:quinone reductase-like Zn-dependent oxidoreductase
MKAIWVTGFAPLDEASHAAAITDVPDPLPGPNQILIDVGAADANYPDLLVIEGRYQVKPPLPFVPGKAAAGTVAVLGPGVIGFALGDRVAAQVEYGPFGVLRRRSHPRPGRLRYPLRWSDYRDRAPEAVAVAQQEIFALHRAGRLDPVIDCVLPLSQFAAALRALRDGPVQGKLILDPSA